MTSSPHEPSDAALMASARTDPDPFRVLYERYAERVHGYFRRRTGNPDAALDLTAETFSQVWAVRLRFRDEAGGSAAPWIFGIARNVLLSSVRRGAIERRATDRLGVMERLDAPHGQTTVLPDETWLDGADELLDTLPPALRQAVRLRVLEGLGYAAVANELGTTQTAARVRVHRGLSALRAHLNLSKEAS